MIFSPKCVNCKNHFGWLKCAAYPNGIPDSILTGEHDHTKPFPGDNGIRFEPLQPGK